MLPWLQTNTEAPAQVTATTPDDDDSAGDNDDADADADAGGSGDAATASGDAAVTNDPPNDARVPLVLHKDGHTHQAASVKDRSPTLLTNLHALMCGETPTEGYDSDDGVMLCCAVMCGCAGAGAGAGVCVCAQRVAA